MAEKTNVLSARVSQGTRDQLEELKKEFGKYSLGKVSDRAVIEKAIEELHEKYIKKTEG